ncbi:MAG: hypothetical protein IPJ87_00100 [Flavobacteriales bacterium]|nr:hypothetical protein [Flavobacteriales bacterium]
MDYAEGRRRRPRLVMGQSPAYWLVLVVQRRWPGHAGAPNCTCRAVMPRNCWRRSPERMDAWAGRSGLQGTEENAPAQARRDR